MVPFSGKSKEKNAPSPPLMLTQERVRARTDSLAPPITQSGIRGDRDRQEEERKCLAVHDLECHCERDPDRARC